MANSSILGAERARPRSPGHDTDALGPSDRSDSGSDIQSPPTMGTPARDADILSAPRDFFRGRTDSGGTGERGSALPDEQHADAGDLSLEHGDGLMAEDEFVDPDDDHDELLDDFIYDDGDDRFH